MTAHVVLFGPPDAGKTSLLGALAQVARTLPKDLGGSFNDVAGNLDELRRQVYDDFPEETRREVVPHAVALERRDAVLVDCDGRVAADVLRDPAASGALASAVRDADAVLLVVDAAASERQLDRDFAAFAEFLQKFRVRRGNRGDVAVLPAFLVLAKCDRLARPGEDSAQWLDRVERRRESAGERFRDFLDAADAGFGSVRLELAATATRTPDLATSPGTLEPFGVAELFRRSLAAAFDYRDRRAAADARLAATVSGGVIVVGLLVAAIFALGLIHHAASPPALTAAVEQYRARDGLTPSSRLREPLHRKAAELAELAGHPEFGKLSEELRVYVTNRREELDAYRSFRERLVQLRPPVAVRGDDELQALERQLHELEPPAQYRREWGQTEAIAQRDKWLTDAGAIRAAVSAALDWYRGLKRDGDALYLFTDRGDAPVAWADWSERANLWTDRASRPPYRPGDRLPAVTALPTSPAVTWATPLAFPAVEQARAAVERLRGRLEMLRDVVAALGLGGDGPAVLRFPDSLAWNDAAAALAELVTRSPRYRDWSLAALPDAVAPDIRRAAEAADARLLAAGRAELARLHRQKHGADATVESWRTLTDAVAADVEWKPLRELSLALRRLSGPRPVDPVAELAAFLKRDAFEVPIAAARLTLPDDWKDRQIQPAGPWLLVVQDARKQKTIRSFWANGDGQRDAQRRRTAYVFVPEPGPPLTVRPGDVVWAELPMKAADGAEWKLSWWANGSRSALYQFERLALPPRLHRAGQAEDQGELSPRVTLELLPDGAVPAVPALLP